MFIAPTLSKYTSASHLSSKLPLKNFSEITIWGIEIHFGKGVMNSAVTKADDKSGHEIKKELLAESTHRVSQPKEVIS